MVPFRNSKCTDKRIVYQNTQAQTYTQAQTHTHLSIYIEQKLKRGYIFERDNRGYYMATWEGSDK